MIFIYHVNAVCGRHLVEFSSLLIAMDVYESKVREYSIKEPNEEQQPALEVSTRCVSREG